MTTPNKPAFPAIVTDPHNPLTWGMTLREYLAAQAMMGIRAALAGPYMAQFIEDVHKKTGLTNSQIIAQLAVADADFLIVELNQKRNG